MDVVSAEFGEECFTLGGWGVGEWVVAAVQLKRLAVRKSNMGFMF